jgi:hypothetical protein
MINMPHFETEREEADWWYDNRNLLEKEFVKAIKAGVKPGPSRAIQELAKVRGITYDELIKQMKANSKASEELAALPRSA